MTLVKIRRFYHDYRFAAADQFFRLNSSNFRKSGNRSRNITTLIAVAAFATPDKMLGHVTTDNAEGTSLHRLPCR